MHKRLFIVGSGLLLAACKHSPHLTLADVVDLKAIEQAQISNDSGAFVLSKAQLKQLKKDLGPMPYAPGDFKDGSIDITLRAKGQNYYLNGRTHGDVVGLESRFITHHREEIKEIGAGQSLIFFRTNGANLAAYAPDTTHLKARPAVAASADHK